MTPALRWAVMRAILLFHLLLGTNSQDSVHRPQFFMTRWAEAESNWGLSAYQPNALLLGQTGSLCLYPPSPPPTHLIPPPHTWHLHLPISHHPRFLNRKKQNQSQNAGARELSLVCQAYVLLSCLPPLDWRRIWPAISFCVTVMISDSRDCSKVAKSWPQHRWVIVWNLILISEEMLVCIRFQHTHTHTHSQRMNE